MQALNPLLVMLLIPFNNIVLYPMLRRMGMDVTALKRMGWGIAISGVSWIVAGALQLWIDSGAQVSLAWQSLPYLRIALACSQTMGIHTECLRGRPNAWVQARSTIGLRAAACRRNTAHPTMWLTTGAVMASSVLRVASSGCNMVATICWWPWPQA